MESVTQTIESFLERIDPYVIIVCDSLWTAKESFNDFSKRNFEPYQLVSLTIATTLLLLFVKRTVRHLLSSNESWWKRTKRISFRFLISLPFMRNIVKKEIDKSVKSLKDDLMKPYVGKSFFKQLPDKGFVPDEISKLIRSYMDLGEVEWKDGKVSGGIYAPLFNIEFTNMMTDVYSLTGYTNPLHADVFPGIRKMKAEVVRMTCKLFNGDDYTCGTMTSGGTESIVMACKAMRDYARSVKGITNPEMIVPITVHAGFDKAADLLGIRIIHVPIDSTSGMVNVHAMKRAISRNTIMLVGSSPNFPHGIIDPVDEIAKLGLRYDIPVHVDCCLGGFLLPFMREAGSPVPVGDFSIRGVVSISADTHKYGYAPKGNSVVMYRNAEYRKYQFAVVTDWPGGVYVTPTISGSRAGANIATCWAALMYHGNDGYVESTRKIMAVARKIKHAISNTPGLKVVGDPLMSVIAVTSDTFNILQLSYRLTKKGWNLNTLQFPSSFHICVTLMHTKQGVADQLIQDIRDISEELCRSPKQPLTGSAAVYGMAQTLPDRSMISDFAIHYMDTYYSTETTAN